ncbi:MAG: glycerol-3-phosphate acyltransferase [Anaerolineae bacterium]
MNPWIALLAAIAGYALGSISFARLIARRVTPQEDISRLTIAVPGSEARIESDAISATTVRLHLGAKWGGLTSLLDMLKAALPALAFRLWHPEAGYFLIAAGMATVGHIWPVQHRFKGGRGMSPILGGMLVLDPLGAVVTNVGGMVIGLPLKDMVLITGAGIVFMIPWIWFRTHDGAKLAYVLAMNTLYWSAMIPEWRELLRLHREGRLDEFRQAAQLRVLRPDGRETIDSYTPATILARLKALFGRKG